MIINRTKKQVLISKHRVCASVFSKGFGFMLHRKPDYALVFTFKKERYVPITMFLVFFQLDLLFLDGKKRVMEMARLRPFRDYSPKKKAQYVVELPIGKLGKTKVGDVVEWK